MIIKLTVTVDARAFCNDCAGHQMKRLTNKYDLPQNFNALEQHAFCQWLLRMKRECAQFAPMCLEEAVA